MGEYKALLQRLCAPCSLIILLTLPLQEDCNVASATQRECALLICL